MSWRKRTAHWISRRHALGGALSGLAAAWAGGDDAVLAQAGSGAARGGAKDAEVDLNLALAVDASGSVNQERFELQKQGYVTAFGDAQVRAAIRSGPRAAISVTMYQWTGPGMQAPVVLWQRVGDDATVERLVRAIQAAPRVLFSGGTSVSGAIDFGVLTLATCPFKGGRRVIDVSGDGANNRGRSAAVARDAAVAAGININGLPIMELEPDLAEYYRDNVVGGPGSFVVPAATFQDFGAAIRRKLILEIAGVAGRTNGAA
jgi:hypothetical protein